MSLRPWPTEFFEKKQGLNRPQCNEGRAAENANGVRFLDGENADAYLQRTGPSVGYCVVVFRGRHVGDPQSMTPDEHRSFWTDVGRAAKAIEAVFEPVHLNFQLLGNADPHVHVHIVPRYDPDPAPSMPLPASAWENATTLSDRQLAGQLERLKTIVDN